MIASPWWPPFKADSLLSRRNPLLGRSGPWQRKQLCSRIGLISMEKLTWFVAGGGSWDTSGSAAVAIVTPAETERRRFNLQHSTLNIQRPAFPRIGSSTLNVEC